MQSLGRHIIVELFNCRAETLNDVSAIETAMVEAARRANATVINSTFHHFAPFGVSGVVVIQESHLAIHTWPEYGFAALDLFTCGGSVDPWICYHELKQRLSAETGSAIELGRGQTSLLTQRALDNGAELAANAPPPEPKLTRNVWFTERDEDVAQSYRHTGEILFREQSDYQKVEVIDSYAYGKMLLIDGQVMTSEKDEYVYHEMMAHVPLMAHPAIQDVLIIGGGDGGAAREVLRHEGVNSVTLVEIDDAVIRASKEHLPSIARSFDHPKLKLHIEDGIAIAEKLASESFDLILVDSTDPEGPAVGLFQASFYRNLYRALRTPGLLITQSESPRFNVGVFQEGFALFRQIFGEEQVWPYLINVPTYPSGTWALSFSAKGPLHPYNDLNPEAADRLADANHLRYYNAEVHRAAFALPNYVRALLREPVSLAKGADPS